MGLEFIESDELMEVTPKSIRLRKKAFGRSLGLASRGVTS